jgi:hypothetical protein
MRTMRKGKTKDDKWEIKEKRWKKKKKEKEDENI